MRWSRGIGVGLSENLDDEDHLGRGGGKVAPGEGRRNAVAVSRVSRRDRGLVSEGVAGDDNRVGGLERLVLPDQLLHTGSHLFEQVADGRGGLLEHDVRS